MKSLIAWTLIGVVAFLLLAYIGYLAWELHEIVTPSGIVEIE
jgi:hypothetical protein